MSSSGRGSFPLLQQIAHTRTNERTNNEHEPRTPTVCAFYVRCCLVCNLRICARFSTMLSTRMCCVSLNDFVKRVFPNERARERER